MELRIYEKDLTLAYVTDGAEAFTASAYFRAPGRFRLTLPLSEAEEMRPERLLVLPDFGAYILEEVKADHDADTVTVRGREILSYFARRVLTDRITGVTAAVPLLSSLATDYGADTLSAPLTVAPHTVDTTVNAALYGQTVLSAMQNVATAAGWGLSLTASGGGFTFSPRIPFDTGVVLTRAAGHLADSVRETDITNYANRVIVRGENGTSVRVAAEGLFSDGYDDSTAPLHEIAVYASIAPGQYATDALYQAALTAEGERVLATRRPVQRADFRLTEAGASGLLLGGRYRVEDHLTGLSAAVLCTGLQWSLTDGRLTPAATLTLL